MIKLLSGMALAAFLMSPVAALAQEAEPAPPPAATAPTPLTPEGDKAVVDDIENTLRELQGHISVGAQRIRVNPPASAGNVAVPSLLEIPVGKAQSVDLPSDAREIIIGNPATVDVSVSSRRRLFVMGRAIGRSNVYVIDAAGEVIARMEIDVGLDTELVRETIRRAMPDEAFSVESQGATLVLSGTLSSDSAAGRAAAIARQFVQQEANLVNLTKVGREQQVLIQVKVAEVQRSLLKEFGVLGAIGSDAPVFSALNIGAAQVSSHLAPLTANLSASGAYGSLIGEWETATNVRLDPGSRFSFSGIKGLWATLRLLEQRNLVRSLAEPNLVAVSGEVAQMLAGGEYPIPTPGGDGTIAITYRPFGVSLSFLPIILENGRINMKLSTEVSSVNSSVTVTFSGGSVNGFTVRRASSTVELPNGGALMIAGLLQNDVISGLSGVPGIMDVPILGKLFSSDAFRRNETELVVIVSATLVRPTGPASLVTPADSVSPGGDLDLWLFRKMTGRYSPGFHQETDRKAVTPAFGFIFDEVGS